MTKSFLIAVIICIVALGVFVYFIFGFNQRPEDTNQESQLQSQTQIQTSPEPIPADLKIEDTVVGSGKEVKTGDTVVIHYRGTLEDGTQFDSSYDSGQPYETQIGVGTVIKGWDLGVVGMKVGGKRKLTIPSSLGYGEQGSGPIPPNATLIFELELVEVK